MHKLLQNLLCKYKFESTTNKPRGLIPDFIPVRASFENIRGFSNENHLKMARFHALSKQIILAAQPESDATIVTSYSARRLLPSLAELWHLPEAVRNKVGGWNSDEVRVKGPGPSMADNYAHFQLESQLHVKVLLMDNLRRMKLDLRTADTTT